MQLAAASYAFNGVQVRTIDETQEIAHGGLMRNNNPSSPEKSLETWRAVRQAFRNGYRANIA